jgi:hypothetical protein
VILIANKRVIKKFVSLEQLLTDDFCGEVHRENLKPTKKQIA